MRAEPRTAGSSRMTGDTDRDKLPEGSDELRNANGMARRRLVRSALAAPVVLSSLASKPVLGAEAYNCTESGQLSGNTSSHPGDVICAQIGSSRSFWLDSNSWTTIIKGDLPNASGDGGTSKKSSSSSNWSVGTRFNGYSGLESTFYYSKSSSDFGALTTSKKGEVAAASMYQVLAAPDSEPTSGSLYDLGRATVVSLLNCYSVGPSYPVTPAKIVAMFNATNSGHGTYRVNSSVSWTRSQVIEYLESLYPPG